MNNTGIVIMVIWVSALGGSMFTGKVEPFYCAFWITLAIGLGYLIMMDK